MNLHLDCHWLSLGLALALGSVVSTQTPDGGTLPDSLSIVRQAHGVGYTDGSLVGGGADYRVEFLKDGVRYVPALGRRSPHSMPLVLGLRSIDRGGMPVAAGDGHDYASPRLDGNTVQFARPDGVLERYTVGPEGTELSFVFPIQLDGTGDLVVHMEVTTDLEFVPTTEGGVRFAATELGGIHVGDVIGIDADGRAAAGSIAFVQGELELRLPDAFVAKATYPLILDPLISTVFNANASASDYDEGNVDVAYDSGTNQYLMVWDRTFSLSDIEVRGQLVSSSGSLLGSFISFTNSPEIALNPTVGNLNETNMFLVAWQVGSAPFGPFDIACRSFTTGGTLSAIVPISAIATANEVDPDLANDPDTGADHDEALLVWTEEGAGIRGMQVTVPSVGDPVAGSVVNLSTDTGDGDAAISKGAGFDRHLVVWTREFSTTSAIFARAVNKNMSTLTGETAVQGGTSLMPGSPEVDGDGTTFMVTYDRLESSSRSERNIYCRMVRYSSGSLTFDTAIVGFETDNLQDERSPAVGYLGNRYVVAWSEAGANLLDYDLGIAFTAPDNCTLCGTTRYITGTKTYDRDPAIATTLASGEIGSLADDGVVLFVSNAIAPPFNGDANAQRVQALGSGGPVANIGGGCGLSGTIGRSGPAAIGNPAFEIRLSGVAGALGGVLTLDTSPPVFPPIVCGTCSVLQGVTTLFPTSFDSVAGTAATPVPLPCLVDLIGDAVEFQWLIVAIGPTPCPIVPNISASDRLRVTFGE